MTNANPIYLFTYGTLMQGFDNPFATQLHENSIYEGKGHFPGMLYLISWYPGAIYDANAGSNVHGDIFRLSSPETLIPQLDEYEDVFEDEKSSLYLRKSIAVTTESSMSINCWVYLYNQSVAGLEHISDGRFKRLV